MYVNWCLDNGELSEYLEGIRLQQAKSGFQLLIVDSYLVILSTDPFDITLDSQNKEIKYEKLQTSGMTIITNN